MIIKQWKNTNIKTSYLGFGAMRLPTDKDGKIDKKHTAEMIQLAFDNNVNYFDTAWFYHDYQSEKVMGELLSKYERSSYYLTSKMPIWEVNTLEEAKDLFNKQLENCKTDYFDAYLVHALSKEKWEKVNKLNVMPFLEEMKKQGKIKYIGFSFHSDLKDFEMIVHDYKWEVCQIQLNYMDTEYQQGMKGLEILNELDIPVIIMEPLKGGKLSNLSDKYYKYISDIDSISTKTHIALKWFSKYKVDMLLSGMSNIDHIKENIKTCSDDSVLSEEIHSAIEKAAEHINNDTVVNCTACNYCMPCPHDVNIPGSFVSMNNKVAYSNISPFEEKHIKSSMNCTACGECLDKCPQKIEIIDVLGTYEKYL